MNKECVIIAIARDPTAHPQKGARDPRNYWRDHPVKEAAGRQRAEPEARSQILTRDGKGREKAMQ